MGESHDRQAGSQCSTSSAGMGYPEFAANNKRLAAELEAAYPLSWDWISSKRPTPTPPQEPRGQVSPGSAGLSARRRQLKNLKLGVDRNAILPLPTGHLEDFFELGEELGRGHFGLVRTCIERSTRQLWACKSIDKHRFKSWDEKEEVRREIAIMQHLSGHPHVVGLKAVYEDKSYIHLVMELCQGGELFDLINAVGSFEEVDAAEIFRQLTEVISACHAKGVMHRDIKPENILLVQKLGEESTLAESFGKFEESRQRGIRRARAQNKPRIKLADFGLALFVTKEQKAQGLAGSPLYLAPEILSGSYGHSADIWSLGVILYILLCGSAPFCGESDLETVEQIESGHVDFSSVFWDTVSWEAIDLVQRMLSMDPKQRPTAVEVLQHPWLVKLSSRAPSTESVPRYNIESGASLAHVFGQPALSTFAGPTSPRPSPAAAQVPSWADAYPFVFSSKQESPKDSQAPAVDSLAQNLYSIQYLTPVTTLASSPMGSALTPTLPTSNCNALLAALASLNPTSQSGSLFCKTAQGNGSLSSGLDRLLGSPFSETVPVPLHMQTLSVKRKRGVGSLESGSAEDGSPDCRCSPRGPLDFSFPESSWLC